MKKILIIDDEKDIRNNIKAILNDENYLTNTAENSDDALELIKKDNFDLIILDVWLNDSTLDGIELLKILKKLYYDIPVIIISGHGNIEMAVDAIKEGAQEFIEKPFSSERLILSVSRSLEVAQIKYENQKLKEKDIYDYQFIGNSQSIQKIKQLIAKVASTSSRVLIYGESGTGKDVVAKEIHRQSKYSNGPFVVINAAILEPDGIENELFGFDNGKGEVTTGMFEKAHNGTMFIDEVGEMPLQTQAKILRVLTDQSFTRVGSDKIISINSRIICSSTKDLNLLIENGSFRKDLFHRLNVVNITIPNLSERIEDIDLIIDYFSKYLSELNSVKNIDLKPLIRSKYLNYEWPGNIRELRNLIERYIILGEKFYESDSVNENLDNEAKNVISMPLKNARKIFEKNYLQSQIKRFNGNISKTASFIGMERSALHRKLKQLGINEEDKQ
tara:strand:+ start:2538 stop:3875 length:1338 start_codon:yes stop_codon:yes gene_type:complete